MRTLPDESPALDLKPEAASEHLPERRCILTQEHGPRALLVRLALGPDGALWPDLGSRLPGRGAWIRADRALLEDAISRGRLRSALARAFRTAPPTIPAALADQIEKGLQRRALDRLGLELRAGHLILGSDKITEWARAGRLNMLLHAADAAPDGVAKLDQAFRVGGGDMANVLELPAGRVSVSAALGRENVVHSGITHAKAADRIRNDVLRWRGFAHDLKMQTGDGAELPVPHIEGRE